MRIKNPFKMFGAKKNELYFTENGDRIVYTSLDGINAGKYNSIVEAAINSIVRAADEAPIAVFDNENVNAEHELLQLSLIHI